MFTLDVDVDGRGFGGWDSVKEIFIRKLFL
jgi:hypothetical protein